MRVEGPAPSPPIAKPGASAPHQTILPAEALDTLDSNLDEAATLPRFRQRKSRAEIFRDHLVQESHQGDRIGARNRFSTSAEHLKFFRRCGS